MKTQAGRACAKQHYASAGLPDLLLVVLPLTRLHLMNAKLCARRAALLAIVLAAPAGAVWAGFVDNRPAPAPAVAIPAAADSGVVTTPVGPAATSRAASPSAMATPAQSFTVTRSDGTIREALASWSKRAGWTHEPENWTVPVDLPILSADDLGVDFKAAVRALLSSTDLTNMPLQPCFYSNKVLRVVPKAELCDKNPS